MNKTGNAKANVRATTPKDVSRIQSAFARTHGGVVPKGNHVGRMAAAAAKNFGKSGGK
jgi:hypothetical protein